MAMRNNPVLYIDLDGRTWGIFKPFVKAWDWTWKTLNDFAQWADKNGIPSANFGAGTNSNWQANPIVGVEGQQFDFSYNNLQQGMNKSVKKLNYSIALTAEVADYSDYINLGRSYRPKITVDPLIYNGIVPDGTADQSGGDGNLVSNWWNTHWTAKIIPDVVYINASGGVTAIKKGFGGSTGYALPIRGKQAFHLYGYRTFSNKVGGHIGVSDNVGYSTYTGIDARNFDFVQLFGGYSAGWEEDLLFGISHSKSTGSDLYGGYLISNDIGLGIAIGGCSQINNTTVWPIW